MVAFATNALDRVLGVLANSLPAEVAEQLAQSKLDPATQALLNQLADKSAAGTLSEAERGEYLELIEAVDFLSIFQAKARDVLTRQIMR